jgi:hypothetical protein
VLAALWLAVSAAGVCRWRRDRAVGRQDDQLRALLAGRVPLPRTAPDDASPVSARRDDELGEGRRVARGGGQPHPVAHSH